MPSDYEKIRLENELRYMNLGSIRDCVDRFKPNPTLAMSTSESIVLSGRRVCGQSRGSQGRQRSFFRFVRTKAWEGRSKRVCNGWDPECCSSYIRSRRSRGWFEEESPAYTSAARRGPL